MDTKYNFGKELIAAAQQSVLKIVTEGNWIEPKYENRLSLPDGFVKEVWRRLDKNRIQELIAKEVENRLAEKLANFMMQEFAGEIRTFLHDNPGVKEAAIATARERLAELVKPKEEKKINEEKQ
ncbi:MAG: hypothetical protein WC445_04805 [Patescibacteria group bacterium]